MILFYYNLQKWFGQYYTIFQFHYDLILLKEDIIKEYGLSNDVKQQDYILQHILKELKTHFN